MNWYLLTLSSTALLNIGMGLFVLTRKNRSQSSTSFFALTLSITIWAFTNYLTDNYADLENARVAARLVFVSGYLVVLSMYWFAYSFRNQKLKRKISLYRQVFWITVAVVGSVFSASSLIVGQLTPRQNHTDVAPGPLFIVFVIILLALFIGAAYHLNKVKRDSTDIVRKDQALLIIFGSTLSFILGILFNAVIPALTSNWIYARFGPPTTVIMVGSIAYAMIRHKLFDIRGAVARATAYSLSLATIATLYGGAVYVLSESIFTDNEYSRTIERFIFIIFAIFTAAIFQPLKKFFDRITNFIFFRDAYDSSVFFAELNNLLAQATNLDSLLLPSARLVQQHMRLEYCAFGIKETEYVPRRIIGTSKKEYKDEDIAVLRSLTTMIKNQIVISDELAALPERTPEFKTLLKLLNRYSVAALARLTDRPQSADEGLGYLILGPKKSGNHFTSQDIKVLGIVVNSLVLGIQNAIRFEEIERFNETLQEKIFTATRELKHSNDKLKALDQAKDEFVSMASHQLRTPLTSVKGYLSMLSEGDAGKLNPTQQQFVEQSFASSQRMVYLISDLLNVSRLKTGKFVIEKVPTDLSKVVQEELSQLKGAFDAKKLHLNVMIPKTIPALDLDETKIRQVIMNFVDNAIYYTPDGGKIEIKLESTPKQIEFTVTDSGIGVPKDVQHHLFMKFYRADNARKMRPDGTGIGLFMAKKVVTAQGGSIVFKSSEGKGSTFGFVFPLKS